MRHPKRLLREFLDDEVSPSRAAAVQSHLARCSTCRAEAARQRRSQSRLRSAAIPRPGTELLEHFERTASPGTGVAHGYTDEPAPTGKRRHRAAMLAAGAAAAVGLVLSTAYLLGGWSAGPALTASAPGLAAGWSDVTGGEARQLTTEQIDALRAHGWSCPELRAVGMSLVAAQSVRVDGQPAVLMTLEGKEGSVTVYEIRSDSGTREPAVDGFSGHSVTDEGFVRQDENPVPGRPEVWLHPQRPQQAVIASQRVTYSIGATPDRQVLEDAVSEISLTESSRLVRHIPDTAQGLWDRIQRGLAVMTGTGAHP